MSKKQLDRSADFNLFLSSDTVLGTLESIFELTMEVPRKGEEMMLWVNALTGLAEAGRKAARDMNIFLYEASDSHDFPTTWSSLETDEDDGHVRDARGIYLVGSR